MGYELDRLMNQYGVGSPSLSYSGMNKPVSPGEYSYVAPAEGTTGPTDAEQKANWQTLLTKYNTDMPGYTADQAAYNTYKQQYQDRIANTPQYLQSQFNTSSSTPSTAPTFSPASLTATSPTGIGTERMNSNIQSYFAANPAASAADIATQRQLWGVGNRDIRNAMGTGFQYGQPGMKSGYGTSAGSNEALSGGGIGLPQYNQNIKTWLTEHPQATNADIQAQQTQWGISNQDLYGATGNYWGNKLATPGYTAVQQTVSPTTGATLPKAVIPTATFTGTAEDKAKQYNTMIALGYSDAQLRAAAGPQTETDWNYLKQLATSLKPATPVVATPTTGGTQRQAIIDAYQQIMGRVPSEAEIAAHGTAPIADIQQSIRDYVTAHPTTTPTPVVNKAVTQGVPTIPASVFAPTALPADKAAAYQQARGQNYTDAQIRAAVETAAGPQTAADWAALQGLAGYAHGGSVRTHFQSGGLNEMASQYGVEDQPTQMLFAGADQPTQGYAVPQLQLPTRGLADMPGAGASREDQVRTELMAMLNKQQQSAYGEEYKVARERSDRETQAFQDMITKAVAGQADQGPSQAEKYFRLAAAFGAPTKTGGLGESLGNAAQVLSEYNKEQRTAQRAGQMQALQLGLQGQQARMTAARDEASQLRQLTGEELKVGQADKIKLLDYYMKALEPQSPEGKAARDKGLIPGTKEYQAEVGRQLGIKQDEALELKRMVAETSRGNAIVSQSIAQQGLELRQAEAERKAKDAKRLTTTELKLKSGAEDLIANLDQALSDVKQAYALNPQTFDASAPDKIQKLVLETAGSKDPKLLATRTQENLLSTGAISQLREKFGSQFTQAEGKLWIELQGVGAKSKEEREKIMGNMYKALKAKRTKEQKRLNEINQGLYRETTPAGEIE